MNQNAAWEHRILTLLAESPLTAQELRQKLDLRSDGWLYDLLAGLQEAGCIRVCGVRPPKGRGKGTRVYQVTEGR